MTSTCARATLHVSISSVVETVVLTITHISIGTMSSTVCFTFGHVAVGIITYTVSSAAGIIAILGSTKRRSDFIAAEILSARSLDGNGE